MMNLIKIDDYKARVEYDPEIDSFRGEFIGLNGGADFYADNLIDLKKEARLSLKVFLKMCKEDGVQPNKNYSGKFNIRINSELHEHIVALAVADGKSLNKWIEERLTQAG